jgi:hypothetical protein
VTALTTDKLGLIKPSTTDDFKTSEIANTFQILDDNPGILVIPNQAARPSSWTHLQHGRTVRQMDQRVEWVWEKPNSGATGVWKRYWGKGLLHTQSNAGATSSSSTNYNAGTTVIQTPSLLLPGGRPIRVTVRWGNCGNTSGLAIASYWEGSTRIHDWGINGFDYTQSQWGRTGIASMYRITRDIAPTTQVNMTFKWTISATSDFGLGGTSTMRDVVLEVEEV